MATALTNPGVRYIDYAPRGVAKDLFRMRDKEIIVSGPAGTGKSRGCLEKVNWFAEKHAGARTLMLRRTRHSLTQSAMVTFEKRVLPYPGYVPFNSTSQEYRYPNGSILAVGGLDDPRKIYSSEWDMIYVCQADEIEEADWEDAQSRLRNWGATYDQMLGDANPGPPTHWIRARRAKGLVLLQSRHEDNPELFDGFCPLHGVREPGWTCRGREYLDRLDKLTGPKYKRLRLGIWASAEGAVYEDVWDESIHVVKPFPIPDDWPVFWVIDFGYTNPFVFQQWRQDPDGRLYRQKEIYKTKTIVEDHAQTILRITRGDPKPKVIICDHDAEDRSTLERHLPSGYPRTKAAWKSVSPGIQAVASRLRKAGDGKPRMFYFRDAVAEIDRELEGDHLPTSTVEEYDAYVWATSNGKMAKEEPLKKYDHGQDGTRYLVTHVDETWKIKKNFFAIPSIGKGAGGSETDGNSDNWRFGGNSNLGSRWGGAEWE